MEDMLFQTWWLSVFVWGVTERRLSEPQLVHHLNGNCMFYRWSAKARKVQITQEHQYVRTCTPIRQFWRYICVPKEANATAYKPEIYLRTRMYLRLLARLFCRHSPEERIVIIKMASNKGIFIAFEFPENPDMANKTYKVKSLSMIRKGEIQVEPNTCISNHTSWPEQISKYVYSKNSSNFACWTLEPKNYKFRFVRI